MNKSYAVFGLGRYGTAVAEELLKNGAEVIAVDINEAVVENVSFTIPVCKCADVTDADVIENLGISNIDTVIVAMAQNFEATVMAITLCKEVGVPNVIAKCSDEIKGKILLKVGADSVVVPESESGKRLAKNLLSSGFIDAIDLSNDISILEMEIKEEWIGKTLAELSLRRKYSLNVVAIVENGTVTTLIDPYKPLQKDIKFIVIADIHKLKKLKQ
ncbi:MAG: TrkA family potassium uptake protein [Oscillospiraceae bacterium]|nr:TrkA family potassium uptake protein [Oscillospiraceae bacterium]